MKYLFSAFVLSLIGQTAFSQDAVEPKPVKVPFMLMPSGHFLVTVKVNDKGPYKLIFDTGAPTMLVNNRLAKDSGMLDKKDKPPLFSPFGAMPAMNAKTFEIGPLKAENVPMIVMDHPTVQAFSDHYEKDHGKIDGIVGFPFFSKYKMTVDYQAKELTMTPNNFVPVDVMDALMKTVLGGGADKAKPKVAAPAGQWGIVVDKEAKDENEGVTIKVVMPGSAAEKAGVKVGDRLLTLGGRWTDSVNDTYQAASYSKAGKAVPIKLKRDGKEMTLNVTPASGL